MKIKLNYIRTLALCGSMLFLGTSCKDFLDENNKTNFTQENYFTRPEHAEAAINGIYPSLRFITDGSGTYGGSPFMMLEFPTGLANTDVGQNQFNISLRNLTADADNQYVLDWWSNSYEAIANANLAITRIPGITMNEADKSRLLGEARFLRAYFYFNLVRIFGDVPLILEPINANSADLYPTRTPQEQVYQQIVADLTAAENSALPATDASGRVSLGAVKAQLASVYLTMAGYPLQKGQEYYQKAAAKAKEVIDSKQYRLFDTYEELHTKGVQNQGEFILQTQYQTGIATNSVTAWLLPRSKGISAFSDEFGCLYATPEFYHSYEPGDKRTAEQQFYYTRYSSKTNRKDTVELGGYFIFKYFDRNAVEQTAISDLNWTLLRYAEVLLTYAEASNEVGGPSQPAYDAVNAIRKRANLSELSGLNQSQFREAIWRERYHELCYENKTWFDMVRTRQVFNPANGTFDNFVGHQFTYGPVLTEKYLLFPIPTREIQNNKKLTQNKDW